MTRSEYRRVPAQEVIMTIRNVTPRPISIFGIVIGAIFIVVGGWLLYSDWETLFKFLKLFGGFFLLLFGLGVLGASLRR